ncbi:[FeFe] hydrogenase, group A [Eubacterium pyruvativorans]|uniref:[FeFe] hydrogenase, group A n=1 Tax=Eubacterium pyruvativorans TaxID=155865 RepID=UPI0023EF9331|nr:[FeFe] hydrogenase, group A [Eubacterium pyruvativorans]MCI5746750.1 [FeFe] hydrogenase, group A [Eubacterium pyruvativorans]MDD7685466.1 [FeFe] hydrogenase, group A [Eubacterium pyruvativorans]
MVSLTIDNRPVTVPEGTSILDAAKKVGIYIPTLCFLKDVNEIGACRVCVVEIEGYTKLMTACSTTVQEGMVVHTNNRNVRVARRNNVELILSEHDSNCVLCTRSGNCGLQKIAQDLNIHHIHFEKKIPTKVGNREFPLIREYSKCIKCMRCVQFCDKIQDSRIWDIVNLGHEVTVDTGSTLRLEDSDCALCGQCITHCPVNGLHERDDTDRVYEAINDPDIITVVQIAPSIRAAWGEAFGLSPKFASMKRLASALHQVGFDYIFDTDFSADLTIMEEANEFLERVKNKDHEKFPMFTSCCPGWVRYCKAHYPEFVDQISTSKSPQQMFGAIAKTWYAQMLNVPPSKLCVVSIMPCIAKKHECAIPTINDADAGRDVDYALTTREMNRMIRSTHIDPHDLKERKLDMPLGLGSGAGAIFGATGGVMEAALRTAYYAVTGENPDPDAFRDVRGIEGWKEETFDLNGTPLRVAVVSGLGNAGKLLEALKRGDVEYDFVEVMACPGGCVGGGGQPIHDGVEMAESRGKILYDIDGKMSLRFSHENPSIIDCYEKFLGKPLSERSEHLLHTDHHSWKMPNEE